MPSESSPSPLGRSPGHAPLYRPCVGVGHAVDRDFLEV